MKISQIYSRKTKKFPFVFSNEQTTKFVEKENFPKNEN